MRIRALAAFVLSCLACGRAGETSRLERGGTPAGQAGGIVEAQRADDPLPATPPLCSPGPLCIQGFALGLEASQAWPLGRYFLRVALDRRPPTVCEIAFESIVGAVTDTCNHEGHDFSVAYRYDDETRAIDGLSFGLVSRVDVEILVAENLRPLVEVHHNIEVQKCSYSCSRGAPLLVPVQLDGLAQPPSADAGESDAGNGAPDAAVDAGL